MFRPFDILTRLSRFKYWRAGFRRSTVVVNGQSISYWEGGKGDPMLLIHGLGGSTLQDFIALGPALISKYRVITLDLPGFGLARHVRFRQGIKNQAEFILAFLDSIQLQQTHVLGNSMGGWIALKLAHQNPRRVSKLILTAPAGIRFNHPPLDLFTPSDEDGLKRLLSYITREPPKLPKWFLRDWLRCSLEGRHIIQEMVDSMITGEDLMDNHVHQISTPTLILWGDKDRLIPTETGHRLVGLMPNAQLEILENCGHLIFHERLAQVQKHVGAWI